MSLPLRSYQACLFPLFLALGACSVKSEPAPQPVPVEKSQTLDPVEVSMRDGVPFNDGFYIAINQASGKRDYFITQPADVDIRLANSAPTVAGCDPKQVVVEQGWFEDATQTIGVKVAVGGVFRARAGRRGLLQVAFKNLTGCANLGYSISLEKK